MAQAACDRARSEDDAAARAGGGQVVGYSPSAAHAIKATSVQNEIRPSTTCGSRKNIRSPVFSRARQTIFTTHGRRLSRMIAVQLR